MERKDIDNIKITVKDLRMKIAIVTITGEANYGNSLQNYAVERTFQKMDCKSVTLVAERESFISQFKSIIYSALFDKSHSYIKNRRKKQREPYTLRRKRFCKFNKKFLNMKEKQSFDDYDFVACGSDQVWNFTLEVIYKDLPFYLCQFVPRDKRISFSASIGTDEIPSEYLSTAKKGFEEMKSVSVREEKAKQIIEELTGRTDVVVTIDPTLMLSADEWRKISKKPKYIETKQKILLTYFLGDMSEEVNKYILKISETYDWKIVNLANEWVALGKSSENEEYYTDPSEFLWLIEHCELMMTDSFHGCVFSTIFRKPFRCFSRNEKNLANMNSRMDTLFKKLNLGEWCIGTVEEPVNNVMYSDFNGIGERIKAEQKILSDYLRGALEINEN